MADEWEIVAVKVEKTQTDPHDHITAVQITTDTELPLSAVTADLRASNGDRYYTKGGGEQASVYVRTCPHCAWRDYITTHPDDTTKNNLLDLRRF
jgi:hypothetical protein